MNPNNPILNYIQFLIAGTEFDGQVFVAGGFVRDLVMGHASKDIDLVVTLPNGGVRFAEWVTKMNGSRPPVVFPRFGTAKFNLVGENLPDMDIEAVMPRSEQYGMDGRNPDVSYTSLEEDAKRRDFTVNSLYYNISTEEIVDFTGGIQDIKDGIIRTAINPEIIFADDPLRMLRAVRFATRYNWLMHDDIRFGIRHHAALIRNISQERITDEINKMLVSGRPEYALRTLWDTDLLKYVLPEIHNMVGVTQNKYHDVDVFEHTLRVVENVPQIYDYEDSDVLFLFRRTLITRLAALFHDVAKPVVRSIGEDGRVHFYDHESVGANMVVEILQRMRYPNDVIRSVSIAVAHHMRMRMAGPDGKKVADKTLRKFRVDLGENLELTLDLMDADCKSHAPEHRLPDQIPGIRARLDTLSELIPSATVTLPIDGSDIIRDTNTTPGIHIGQALSAVKEAWFDNPNLSREEALVIARAVVFTYFNGN